MEPSETWVLGEDEVDVVPGLDGVEGRLAESPACSL